MKSADPRSTSGERSQSLIPAVGFSRQPLFDFRESTNDFNKGQSAREEVRLIITMHFGMQADEAHEQRCPRNGRGRR